MSTLRNLRQATEATPEDVGALTGLLAHDLRNPLAAMLSNLSFMSAEVDSLNDELREVFEDLLLSVESMTRITDSLEVFGREMSAAPVELPQAVSASSVVDAILPQAKRAAGSHGVTLMTAWDSVAQREIRAVEPHASRALSALLHNSIALSPSRGEVLFQARADAQQIVFSILDSGPILSTEIAPRAFSALEQVGLKTNPEGRYSRGLGLYVAGASARAAGGELRALTVGDRNAFELSFRSASS
ncbi:MAG: HAMP domain-containing histidine kinase [Polyangiaceae bacterium]|nr:HAMP domain-containing histidine kinase [Polyangiaceae bacterium]